MDGRTNLPRSRYVRPLEDVTIPPAPRNYGPPGVEPAIEVKIKPVKIFPPDANLTGALDITFTAGQLAPGFRGFRLINVVGTILVDLNGGGGRTVLDRDTYDNIDVQSVRLVLSAGASCTLQSWGEG